MKKINVYQMSISWAYQKSEPDIVPEVVPEVRTGSQNRKSEPEVVQVDSS